MISSRTRTQLLVFVFITLVGVSYVGARYARLDKWVYDSAYEVNAQFAQSGGIFVGAVRRRVTLSGDAIVALDSKH